MRLACALGLVAATTAGRPLQAQCANGTPRDNCKRAAPPPDPKRIAILPFRVSGADPALAHLNEALVDLVAPYFNGELGSQAVEPGEAIAAWKRAGAGPAPATQAVATSVARTLGAGQVAYSSVVSSGRRVTVTSSILRVPGGAVIAAAVHVEGSVDSLAALARALATQLLGQREGAMLMRSNDPGTASEEAARAYIDGMAAYRARHATDALKQFRRAVQLDSSFALAAYRLAICFEGQYGPSAAGNDLAILRRLWSQRERLSGEQRQLFLAVADENGLLFRMASLPRLRRAVTLLPNSAEAHDLLGTFYLKVGALLGYEDWAARAKAAFQRALELDTALAVNSQEGLTDLAFMERDVRSHARFAQAFPGPVTRYQAAILRADPLAIRAARVEYARDEFFKARYAAPLDGTTGAWPPRELDSLLAAVEPAATTDTMRRKIAWSAAHAATNFGRPAQAIEALWRRHGTDSSAVYFLTLMFAQGDSAAAERTFAMLDRAEPSIRSLVRSKGEWACNASLSRLRRGDTTGTAAIAATLRPDDAPSLAEIFASPHASGPTARLRGPTARDPMCGAILRGVLSSATGSDGAALRTADSLMRAMPLNCCDYWNYDLALAFARRGEYAAAAAAVRRRWIQQSEPAPRLAIALLQEGRWAAKSGDTTAAIKAYRHYLEWRENPEPVLVPQRDSARAELAALSAKAGHPARKPPSGAGRAR